MPLDPKAQKTMEKRVDAAMRLPKSVKREVEAIFDEEFGQDAYDKHPEDYKRAFSALAGACVVVYQRGFVAGMEQVGKEMRGYVRRRKKKGEGARAQQAETEM